MLYKSATVDVDIGTHVFVFEAGLSIVVSSENCFHNIYHRGSRFTQLPTYLFSVVRLARGAVASFD
jgi:hypothetical protein